MADKMTTQEAVEFGKFTAVMDRVDFEAGEGKVIVFNNAVIILSATDDGRIECQLVRQNYRRVDVDVIEDDVDWGKYL